MTPTPAVTPTPARAAGPRCRGWRAVPPPEESHGPSRRTPGGVGQERCPRCGEPLQERPPAPPRPGRRPPDVRRPLGGERGTIILLAVLAGVALLQTTYFVAAGSNRWVVRPPDRWPGNLL